MSEFHFRAGTLEEQRRIYWEQADFGYIKKKMDTMKYICKRKTTGKVTQYLLLTRHDTIKILTLRLASYKLSKIGWKSASFIPRNRPGFELLLISVKYHIQVPHSGVFIVNFEHISHLVLVFLLLTLNMYLQAGFIYFYLNYCREEGS